MLSTVLCLRSHLPRSTSFTPRCCQLVAQKGPALLLGHQQGRCRAGTRHASTASAACIRMEPSHTLSSSSSSPYATPDISGERLMSDSSTSSSPGASPIDAHQQPSEPVKKKRGRKRKGDVAVEGAVDSTSKSKTTRERKKKSLDSTSEEASKPTKESKPKKEPKPKTPKSKESKPKKEPKPKTPKSKEPKPEKEPKPRKDSKPKEPKPRRKIADLPPRRIEAYLDRIEKEGDSLSIPDVERYRPATQPERLSPGYPKAYKDAMSTLFRSFSTEQFRRIVSLYGLSFASGSSRTKRECAELFLEKAWGWMPISKVQEELRDREEVVDTNIRLEPPEISLLSGQDGQRLQDIAARYDIKLHLNKGQTSLRMIGRRGQTKRFRGYLDNFRQDIVTEDVSLPPSRRVEDVDEETIAVIRKMTGVFIAKHGDKLSFSFLRSDSKSAERARYLVVQAISEEQLSTLPGALLPGPPSLHSNRNATLSYSLFPYTVHRSPSWRNSDHGTFRLRRVGHWLDTIQPRTGMGLGDVLHQRCSVILGHGSPASLHESLTGPFSNANMGSDITITATTGHVLFTAPPQLNTLRPPVSGPITLNDVLGQSNSSSMQQKEFHPCASGTLESQEPLGVGEYIHKLTYILDQPANELLNQFLVLEVQIEKDGLKTNEKACYIQQEFAIDLSMPERPLDIRLSASVQESIVERSDVLDTILDDASPVPLTVDLHNKTYTLLSRLNIRRQYYQSKDSVNDTILIDTVTDTQTGSTSSVGKIICKEHQTEAGWSTFLQGCDRLTATK